MPVRVSQKDFLPPSTELLEGGEIRIVARGGMTQIRIPMEDGPASGEIRPRVAAALAFLDEPGLPTEARPEDASVRIVTLKKEPDARRAFNDWIATIEKLEAVPAPLDAMYSELNRVAQRIEPADRADNWALLESLSRIRGAHAAKNRFLGLAGDKVGEKLLEKAKALDASVRRTPGGEEGIFHLAVGEDRIFCRGPSTPTRVSRTSTSFSRTTPVLSRFHGRFERRTSLSASKPYRTEPHSSWTATTAARPPVSGPEERWCSKAVRSP